MTRKPRSSPVVRLVVVLAVLAAAGWGAQRAGWFGGEEAIEVRGQAVRRGPMRITVLQRGNLAAKDSAKVVNELEGQTQILTLVDEGSHVEAGDVVATLDASALRDKEVVQDIAVQNAQAALTKAQQNLEIQKSQNASDLAAARQRLEFAEADLRKYLEGDWPQQLQAAEEEIVLATEELAQAEDRLKWSEKLAAEGFLTQTELEADRLAMERARIKLEQSKRKKDLLEEFDHPKQKATFEAAVVEARRELERVELQAKARLVDLEAEVRNAKARLQLETEKLDKLRDQIDKSVLRAPASGIVVYARTEGRYGRSGDLIEEGATVRQHQEIATIPQSGGMIATASLHESVIEQVDVGMPCTVRVDAIPGREYRGHVSFVALLPDSGSWWANPNQRLFRTEIALDETSPELRPGMSCSVEILVDEIPDALQVPVQAVFHSGGRTICFVDGEPREVEVGKAGEAWVQVLSGLEEGEVVALSVPPGQRLEASPRTGDGRPDGAGRGGGPDGGRKPQRADGGSRAASRE